MPGYTLLHTMFRLPHLTILESCMRARCGLVCSEACSAASADRHAAAQPGRLLVCLSNVVQHELLNPELNPGRSDPQVR